MTLYLKGLQKYDRSKLRLLNPLKKEELSTLTCLIFNTPLDTGSYSASLEDSMPPCFQIPYDILVPRMHFCMARPSILSILERLIILVNPG